MAPGRKTGGRRPGSTNVATAHMKAQAQKYTHKALETLATIMEKGTPDNARVAAASALLDRAHGKPAQALTADDGGPLVPAKVIHEHLVG